MEAWITFTLLAVVMQSLRTASQKQVSKRISIQAATLVRFLFGIKFAALYFFLVMRLYQPIHIELTSKFIISGALASVSQILATVFLIKALTLRNFSVGTALAKTEALLTAILGAMFFSAHLPLDSFFEFLVHPISPTLPESHQQNISILKSGARAAKALFEDGYDVFVDWFI